MEDIQDIKRASEPTEAPPEYTICWRGRVPGTKAALSTARCPPLDWMITIKNYTKSHHGRESCSQSLHAVALDRFSEFSPGNSGVSLADGHAAVRQLYSDGN